MDIHSILRASQIVIAAILVALVLLQQRGGGLSGVFGGGGEFYGTRRGLEKTVFVLTIVFATLFIISALLGFVIG